MSKNKIPAQNSSGQYVVKGSSKISSGQYVVKGSSKSSSGSVVTGAGQKLSKTNTQDLTVKSSSKSGARKSVSDGRFLAAAASALKPVTKRASISGAQADKAVRTYLITTVK